MFYFIAMDTNSKVLGHFALFYCFNTNCFQRMAEINQCLVVIQFTPECQTLLSMQK